MTLKQRIKFFFQGKPYLKIITIILSAAAFAFCSIGSTGLTTDRADYLAEAILNIPDYTKQATPGVTILYDHQSDNALAEKGCFSQGVLDIFEKNIHSTYLYGYQSSTVDMYYSIGGKSYVAISDEANDNLRLGNSLIVAGSQNAMEGWGFSLVAGNYPTEPNQVAICEEYYELFNKFGYVYATDLYKRDDSHTGWYCDRFDDGVTDEVIPVNDYSDIIGKTVVFYGDPEKGLAFDKSVISELEIVGIINTDSGKVVEGSYAEDLVVPAYKLYVADSWREAYFKKDGVWNDNKCGYLYVVRPDSYNVAYEIAEACVKATDYVKKYSGDTEDLTTIVAPYFLELLLIETGYSETFALIGALLGVIAVVLQFFAVNVSFAERKKQIGILQSLGANRKTLTGMFVLETVATSLCSFVLAVPTAYGIFYGYIYEATYNFKYLVHGLTYTPVNLVILAALCFVLPMIAALASIFRFLKRAPIENIRKFKKAKPPRISREEKKRERDLKKLEELKDKYENK